MAEHDTQAVIGYGTQVQIEDAITPGTYATVEDVITSDPPDEQADTIEVLTFEATGRTKQKIAGMIDAGQFGYSINARPDVYASHRRILHAKESGENLNHRIITPAGETIDIPCFVKGLKRNLAPNDAYTWDITCEVRGAITTEIAS